jgi:hypothetical protein
VHDAARSDSDLVSIGSIFSFSDDHDHELVAEEEFQAWEQDIKHAPYIPALEAVSFSETAPESARLLASWSEGGGLETITELPTIASSCNASHLQDHQHIKISTPCRMEGTIQRKSDQEAVPCKCVNPCTSSKDILRQG